MIIVKRMLILNYYNGVLQKPQSIVKKHRFCMIRIIFLYFLNIMNINTIILILIILVPLIIIIKKVAGHFINSNKRELVRKLLDEEPTKKIQIIPSNFIRQLSTIMTTKYFCRIFYKKYLDVIKY